ncbi:MAG: AlpA family phage regulatory protein [Candidatus Thiodiazotropha endolucinida]
MKRILRLPQVTDRIGCSKTFIYDAMKNGDFPRQIKLSPQVVGWLESDVDKWIADRAESAKTPNLTDGCVSNNRGGMHA